MQHVLFPLAQIGILGIGLLCLTDAWRKKKRTLFLFLLFDACIFESFILHLYDAVEYNPAFFSLGKIPLMVSAGWAVLLYSLLRVVESENIILKSVYIAQVMVVIDLILDKVAVVSGFWTWNDASGYFQVPYDNFFAWYAYSFLASYFTLLFLQKTSVMNILKAFVYISTLGLFSGYIWNQLPLTSRSAAWWLIFIGTAFAIVKYRDSLEYKSKNVGLLLIPFAFLLFSFFLIMLHWPELPGYYIFISLLLFSCWIAFSLKKIRAMEFFYIGTRQKPIS